MIYVLAAIAGIAGAAVGWLVTGAITAWIASLYGMSDFEGARSMFAFFGVGLFGGLISMVGSAWLVLRFRKGRAPLGRTVARLAIVLGGIAVLMFAGIEIRLHTLDTYTNALPPTLEFEIRLPAALPVPDPSALRVELHTDKNIGESRLTEHWLPADGGHQVIAGSVPLAFKTASRLLVVSLSGEPTRLFRLPLSRDPQSTGTLSPWHRPEQVYVEGENQPRPAPVDDPVEVRYRVRRAGDD